MSRFITLVRPGPSITDVPNTSLANLLPDDGDKNRETHHRYSHFDSLRTSLQALYPVLIVPPIPSKQSLTDYAVKGSSKAKEDATVIARRMRTLEDFLKRLARHPILGGEHVFHRFLDGVSGWVSRARVGSRGGAARRGGCYSLLYEG